MPPGLAFSPDGRWLAFKHLRDRKLKKVPVAGGALLKPEGMTKLGKEEQGHRFPQILPDRKAVLFTIGTGGSYDDARIAVVPLKTGEQRVLF